MHLSCELAVLGTVVIGAPWLLRHPDPVYDSNSKWKNSGSWGGEASARCASVLGAFLQSPQPLRGSVACLGRVELRHVWGRKWTFWRGLLRLTA
jgi:hypothetical protein